MNFWIPSITQNSYKKYKKKFPKGVWKLSRSTAINVLPFNKVSLTKIEQIIKRRTVKTALV